MMAEQKEKDKKSLPAEQIRDLFFDPRVKNAVNKVIPKHLTPEKLLQVAVTVVRRNYQLMQCTKQSLLSSVMGAAILGLELEPTLGQAYLVPFRNKRGFLECQLIPGYRGYITLANRSGEIESVMAEAVYTNDEFEYELGLNPKLRHVPAEIDRGEFKGVYTVFRHKTGEVSFEYMPKFEIEKRRGVSPAKDGPAWSNWYDEMAKKTVIRHRGKFEPVSIEFLKAKELEERAIRGESQLDLLPGAEPIDVEPEGSEGSEETSTPVFDELVKAKAKEEKDISHLKDFIKAVAEANKTTEIKVKEEASKDWDNFWTMYEQWIESNKMDQGEKPEVPKANRGRPKGSKNKPKEEIPIEELNEYPPPEGSEPNFLNCPDQNRKVHKKVCESCEKRQGCPAWA
jgi:recombination protein RecT